MTVFKRIFGLVIGLIFGVLSAFALVPAFAAFANAEDGTGSSWVPWVVILFSILLGVFAPTIRRAFGRGFLLLGASVFALPLSMMLLSGRVTGDMVSSAEEGLDQAAAVVGGGLASIFMTGVSAFIGFFLGAILILIGLVLALGGRREVLVVNR